MNAGHIKDPLKGEGSLENFLSADKNRHLHVSARSAYFRNGCVLPLLLLFRVLSGLQCLCVLFVCLAHVIQAHESDPRLMLQSPCVVSFSYRNYISIVSVCVWKHQRKFYMWKTIYIVLRCCNGFLFLLLIFVFIGGVWGGPGGALPPQIRANRFCQIYEHKNIFTLSHFICIIVF